VRKEIGEQVETKPEPEVESKPETVADIAEKTSETTEKVIVGEPEVASAKPVVVAEPEPIEPEAPKEPEVQEVSDVVETPDVPEVDEVEETLAEPKAPAAKAASAGEDLKRIKGIGAVLEKELNALGINSYEQIANLTVEDLAEARMKLTIMQRAKKDDWLEQAALLVAGESTGFSERVDAGKVPSSSNDTDDKDER